MEVRCRSRLEASSWATSPDRRSPARKLTDWSVNTRFYAAPITGVHSTRAEYLLWDGEGAKVLFILLV